MGDTEDLLAWLRQKHQEMPDPEAGSFYSNAADEIVRLREELGDLEAYAAAWTDTANRHARTADRWQARAERAEADADRLAAKLSRMPCACTWRSYGVIGYRCTKCVVLELHDREVEAR